MSRYRPPSQHVFDARHCLQLAERRPSRGNLVLRYVAVGAERCVEVLAHSIQRRLGQQVVAPAQRFKVEVRSGALLDLAGLNPGQKSRQPCAVAWESVLDGAQPFELGTRNGGGRHSSVVQQRVAGSHASRMQSHLVERLGPVGALPDRLERQIGIAPESLGNEPLDGVCRRVVDALSTRQEVDGRNAAAKQELGVGGEPLRRLGLLGVALDQLAVRLRPELAHQLWRKVVAARPVVELVASAALEVDLANHVRVHEEGRFLEGNDRVLDIGPRALSARLLAVEGDEVDASARRLLLHLLGDSQHRGHGGGVVVGPFVGVGMRVQVRGHQRPPRT